MEKNLNLHETSLLLDERQVSGILGIAVQTLRNWRHESRGPAYAKLSRSVRYRMADIEQYVAQNRIDPETR
ncbi:conserved hypothetical protein [uncultured Desulfobacterium sp.]|uniref:Helix-turn-helix domain-containing protein n=1 Tax=uncultured Desulfobacterium sp. TaxID=201089 RepID=A0A445MRB1_9BACT|nr:conserved hypothetical protein [uncultured Desulfobacterium sp.]